MQRYARNGGAFVCGALLIAIAACSARGPSGGALPPAGQPSVGGAIPDTSPTPPVTAPVTIPYPYTNEWTTKTWSGPHAKPISTKGTDDGVTTVKFAIEKKTGIYDVLERIKSKTGYEENLHSAIGFLKHGGGIAQIILSDNLSFVEGPFTETGTDTYPNGQNSFDFPLTTGNRWSAAAGHTSYINESLSGKGAFEENTAYTETAAGAYEGQTSFYGLGHSKIQDNYASTTQVSIGRPSRYTLSERAQGYNKLTQIFELPSDGYIDVKNEGREPLPVKRGTVKVPDWYPNGKVHSFYSDRFDVIGTASMPRECGTRSGEHSIAVVEDYADLDPVQGFYNTYTASYFLARLAKGQFWFGCIIERYENDTYANGWAMSAGDWGKLSSKQVGVEILIASSVKDRSLETSLQNTALPALTFPMPPVEGRFVR